MSTLNSDDPPKPWKEDTNNSPRHRRRHPGGIHPGSPHSGDYRGKMGGQWHHPPDGSQDENHVEHDSSTILHASSTTGSDSDSDSEDGPDHGKDGPSDHSHHHQHRHHHSDFNNHHWQSQDGSDSMTMNHHHDGSTRNHIRRHPPIDTSHDGNEADETINTDDVVTPNMLPGGDYFMQPLPPFTPPQTEQALV